MEFAKTIHPERKTEQPVLQAWALTASGELHEICTDKSSVQSAITQAMYTVQTENQRLYQDAAPEEREGLDYYVRMGVESTDGGQKEEWDTKMIEPRPGIATWAFRKVSA